MNKTDREYFENRVDNVVRCTNGNITTILTKTKLSTEITKEEKYALIAAGKTTIIPYNDLVKISGGYNQTGVDIITQCFTFPLTAQQKEAQIFNKKIDTKIETLMQEVILEGKRLVDDMVFNISDTADIPARLHKLGEMANLART